MSTETNGNLTATSQQERIILIDSLRGIALLGILMMNIPYFALPDPAADNITLMKETGTINEKVWYFINWFLEGSQRAIFSMLFGAGIILFVTRLQKRTTGILPAEYFIRRQLWLLVFGLVNAFILLWPGDILFQYAIIGVVAFVFRNLKVKYLVIAAGVCLLLMTVRENVDHYRQRQVIVKGEAIAKIDTTKTKLTDLQKESLGAMTGMKEKSDSASLKKEMEKNLRAIRGSYGSLYESQSNLSARFEFYFTYYGIWDVLLFMLLGMAFFKSGILTGSASIKVYWLLTIVGLGAGLLISYFRLEPLFTNNFNRYQVVKNTGFEYYEISRTLRSLGIFGSIMLLYRSGWLKWLFALVRPVGQMAFTNYLMQSLLCAIFFYGIGFGMYGQLQRYQIYFVVAGIWVLEIAWSHIWLKYFRYGPLEWCWRSLTYWKKQPMKRD